MLPFSVTNPLALAALGSIGLLYLSYRTQTRTSTKTKIPSLFFLKQITLQKRIQDKSRLPFRFYLESLVLLLLTLYLADPHWTGYGPEKVAIILDASQSMGARNSSGKSRLDLAKEEIKNIVASSNAHYSLTIIPSEDYQGTHLEGSGSHRTLPMSFTFGENLALEDVKVRPFPDNIAKNFSSIIPSLKTHSVKKVIILSDKEIVSSDLNNGLTNKNSPLKSSINTIKVGSPENNTYISNARVLKNSEGETQIQLSLGFNGSGSTRLKTEVFNAGIFPGRIQGTKGQRMIAEHEVTLSGGREVSEQIPISLPTLKKQETALLRILISSNPVRDSLDSDNEFFLTYSEADNNSIKAYFIGADAGSLEKEARSLEAALEGSVKAISIRDWQQQFKDTREGNTPLNIFYKVPVSTYLITENSLIILPTESTDLLEIQGSSQNPKITSWENNHPVTRYLKLSLLSPARAITLGKPAWGKSIIGLTDGPVLLAGLYQGNTIIVSGLELLPFEGKNDRLSSILLLNMLSYLGSANNLNDPTDSSSQLPANKFNAFNKILPIAAGESISTQGPLDKGIYEGIKDNRASGSLYSVDGFFKEESNTYITSLASLSDDMEINEEENSLGIGWYLAALACALLIIDLLIVTLLRREV